MFEPSPLVHPPDGVTGLLHHIEHGDECAPSRSCLLVQDGAQTRRIGAWVMRGEAARLDRLQEYSFLREQATQLLSRRDKTQRNIKLSNTKQKSLARGFIEATCETRCPVELSNNSIGH